ncbi:MAG TPA: hypothetical protein VGV09_03660 [Steroidobacteraceae bacterium]|nr:hypothetical protein [Steroidobacteraceae bacterium]
MQQTSPMSMRPSVLAVAGLLLVLAAPQGRAASDAATAEPLQEVIVTARRAQLEQRLSEFVSEIAGVEPGMGLPRWQKPVCPLVSGLPRTEGEFILERLSEIARDARVPLAGEQCRANLYIMIYPRPRELIAAMEKHDFYYVFGQDAYPMQVEELLRSPRPVRVWYSSIERSQDGLPLMPCPQGPRCVDVSNLSPAKLNVVRALSNVYLVVDETRLQGVTRGQFADYVAMVALADIKPEANLGKSATILKLFDGAPQDAPPGMSEWDQEFLKSLYATDQDAKFQRTQIMHRMASDLDR